MFIKKKIKKIIQTIKVDLGQHVYSYDSENIPTLIFSLPRWLSWGGYALTLGWLIAGTAVFTEHGFFSPTGAFGLIVLALWLAWVLSLSILLTRRAGLAANT